MNFEKKQILLHDIMCIIGGFFGAYAIVNGFENMGSAQTTNMIEIICTILGRNLQNFFMRILALALYIFAIIICVYLEKRAVINVHKYAICVELIIMIGLVFLPPHIEPLIGLLPIFFMMATQWSAFHGTEKYNCSTIFSTNNLRQCVSGFTVYFLDKDKEQLEKAKFFGKSILWFHIGVVISYFCCKQFGQYASLCAVPLGGIAIALEVMQESVKNNIKVEI